MSERTSVAELAQRGNWKKAEDGLLRWMDSHPNDLDTLAAYATRMFDKGNHGLAIHLYTYLLNVWHEMTAQYRAAFWAQIGTALRFEGFVQESEYAFNRALEIDPQCFVAFCGIGVGLNDNGQPVKALEWYDKALAAQPGNPQITWNRSVALLQLRRWKEGWEGYSSGARRVPRTYHEGRETPEWDGKRNRCVVVWGEQGVGDELMFGTCLPDIISKCREVILDCHPRLEKTLRRSFPGIAIYPTRKTNKILWPYQHKIDRQISIGNLPSFFRNNDRDFPGTPYIKADPERVKHYRSKLEALGPGPYVAIAWFGGEKKTRYDFRSIPLNLWRPLRDVGGTFISIQYNKYGHRKEAAENKLPEWEGYYDPSGPIEDLDEMFALIGACDLVISICQTAIHMAGTLGKECWCLTPNKPSWRYLTEETDMPWYKSVKLIRQGKDESWESVIARVASDFGNWKAAQQAKVQGQNNIRGLHEDENLRVEGRDGMGGVEKSESQAVA